jgi:23S rRNA (uracil1939-C5)-methyltransferase
MSTDPHSCEDEPGTLVLDVAALGNGPDAVARHEGKVVFVPRAAPGDVVRARVLSTHAAYARAALVHRCVPGPAYRAPPCPWIGTCGGCPWQHVTYPVQLDAKARNVREALARIGGAVPARELPILAAPDEWGYRHRVRLHAEPDGRVGFRQLHSHALVEIDACLVADGRLSAVFAPIRRLLPTLACSPESVELATDEEGRVVAFLLARHDLGPRDPTAIERCCGEAPELAGVLVRGRGWERAFGDPTLTLTPAPGLTLRQRVGTFSQVNPAANRLLVSAVLAMAAPARRILDLFCGAGNLSLPLARQGANVLGVDRDRVAVACAIENAARAGLSRARFVIAPAARILRRRGMTDVDLVVLDPPRSGARDVVTALARGGVRRVLYVSCDPATLARDVRVLIGAGYTVDRVQSIDLFPQTEHVETVLEAVLTAR